MLIHFVFVYFSFGSGANCLPFKPAWYWHSLSTRLLREMLSRVNIDEQKVGKAIGRWKLWHDPIVDGQGRRLGTIRSDGRKSLVLEDLSSSFGSRLHLSLVEDHLLTRSLGEPSLRRVHNRRRRFWGTPAQAFSFHASNHLTPSVGGSCSLFPIHYDSSPATPGDAIKREIGVGIVTAARIGFSATHIGCPSRPDIAPLPGELVFL